MKDRVRTLARDVVPPFLWRAAGRAFRAFTRATSTQVEGEEQTPDWYDAMYAGAESYRRHYTTSGYYFLWCVIVDRILRAEARSILDIGCGPGQFACFLRDKGLPRYCGVDFSPSAIELAESCCPEFRFVVADAFKMDLFETFDYDAIVCMEFLEHVEEDVRLLERIPTGTRFYGTVPDFPFTSHVRYFGSCKEVSGRYGDLFNEFRVDEFHAHGKARRFFLLEGVKR